MTHILQILIWKPHDQIHVNIVKAQLSCKPEAFHGLLHRVMSSNDIQCLLLHGLRVDGDTADSMLAQYLKLFSGNGIRSSCLHRELQAML